MVLVEGCRLLENPSIGINYQMFSLRTQQPTNSLLSSQLRTFAEDLKRVGKINFGVTWCVSLRVTRVSLDIAEGVPRTPHKPKGW